MDIQVLTVLASCTGVWLPQHVGGGCRTITPTHTTDGLLVSGLRLCLAVPSPSALTDNGHFTAGPHCWALASFPRKRQPLWFLFPISGSGTCHHFPVSGEVRRCLGQAHPPMWSSPLTVRWSVPSQPLKQWAKPPKPGSLLITSQPTWVAKCPYLVLGRLYCGSPNRQCGLWK
jgi:hypothetical protein